MTSGPSRAQSVPSRILYVVARDRPDLYVALREKFVETPRLAIVLDRRAASAPPGTSPDERRRLTLDEPLRTRGWVLVHIDANGRAALG